MQNVICRCLGTLYGEQCVARDTVWGTVWQDTLYGEQCWQEVWQTVVSILDVVHVVINVVIFFINVLANEVLELCQYLVISVLLRVIYMVLY